MRPTIKKSPQPTKNFQCELEWLKLNINKTLYAGLNSSEIFWVPMIGKKLSLNFWPHFICFTHLTLWRSIGVAKSLKFPLPPLQGGSSKTNLTPA